MLLVSGPLRAQELDPGRLHLLRRRVPGRLRQVRRRGREQAAEPHGHAGRGARGGDVRAHCEPKVRQRAVLQREQLLRDGRRFLRERELVSAGVGCVLGEEDGLG